MEEMHFTNREITLMLDNIHSTLVRIEAQTTKTNGRVSKLETDQAGLIGKISVVATIGASFLATIINRVLS